MQLFSFYVIMKTWRIYNMTEERKDNEKEYNNRKIEGDNVINATICDEIADDSLIGNPGEAVYWRKKAIEHIEKQYGKEHILSIVYYDKLVNDLLEKGSFRQAMKCNEKARKIKKKEIGEYALETIKNDLYEVEIADCLYIQEHINEDDAAAKSMIHIKECLEKNTVNDKAALYKIYSKLSRWHRSFDMKGAESAKTYFVDQAICFAQELYGEESYELIEAYLQKALGLRHREGGEKENEEALKYFRIALLIASKKGPGGFDVAKRILSLLEDCWAATERKEKCLNWVSENISEQFAKEMLTPLSYEEIRKMFGLD